MNYRRGQNLVPFPAHLLGYAQIHEFNILFGRNTLFRLTPKIAHFSQGRAVPR